MRKKEIVLLLAAILVCALAACGSTVQKPDDSALTQTESARPSNTERSEQSIGTEDTDTTLTDADSSLTDTEQEEQNTEAVNTSPTVTESIQTSSENPPQQNEGSASETAVTSPAEPEQPAPIQTTGTDGMDNQNNTEKQTEMKMNVEVGGTVFSATLESNSAVDALVEMMREASVVIQMNDYSGFEKVGSLGTSLPTSNSQTTTHAGDIVLNNGNQIVIFYGSNSWSYTRLGHIDDLNGWEAALGSGDVSVTFSLQ